MTFCFKHFIKLFTIVFAFFFISARPINSDNGYIELKYLGESSKPFSVVTFYLPGSIDTAYEEFYIHKFEVTEIQFDSIEAICDKNIHNSTSDILPDLFEITIVRDEKKKSLLTRDKNELKKMFDSIRRQFNNCDKEKLAKITLIDFQRRLGIAINSNETVPKRRKSQLQ